MAVEIIIAVDAMGGDHAPAEIIQGAVEALQDKQLKLLLVGQETLLHEHLKLYDYDINRLGVVNASEVIAAGEAPAAAIKKKKNSTIVVGLNLVKAGKAQAFVSAGNTGALLAGATHIVKRIKGIERPALATLLPYVDEHASRTGYCFLIDSGANVDVKPGYLVQFAKMGSLYMDHILGITNPRVGLVNIGAEEEKGNAFSKAAYTYLAESDINFVGNIEARDISAGAADVVVCDGFVGNIILKHSEGLAKALMTMVKDELMTSTRSKIGAFLAKSALTNLKKKLDYSEVGGAPFLGLRALVVKAHGSASAKDIKGAIWQCRNFINHDMASKIEEAIGKEL